MAPPETGPGFPGKRVLHITNIPTPYRIPQLNEMSRQFAEAGWTLKVAFGAHGYGRRKWRVDLDDCRFDYVVLRCAHPPGQPGRVLFTYGGLLPLVRSYAPDVIITTGFTAATIKIWLRSLVRETGYLIFSGTTPEDRPLQTPWRRAMRTLLARRASGAVAYGSRAKAYLVSLGLNEADVFVAINTVDTRFFRETTEQLRRERPPGPAKHLTYVGYLDARKNVGRVLDVAARLAERRGDFVLDVVGDGAERSALEDYARRKGLGDRVRFHGYRQKEDIPRFLAASDCFLFQTDFDIWGLVLNEAMAAGLPCVASVHAGATHDLIEHGVNGFAVDFADTAGAAATVDWILDHPREAGEIGHRAARHIAEKASLECSAAGFVRAVLHVCPGEPAPLARPSP